MFILSQTDSKLMLFNDSVSNTEVTWRRIVWHNDYILRISKQQKGRGHGLLPRFTAVFTWRTVKKITKKPQSVSWPIFEVVTTGKNSEALQPEPVRSIVCHRPAQHGAAAADSAWMRRCRETDCIKEMRTIAYNFAEPQVTAKYVYLCLHTKLIREQHSKTLTLIKWH
jgi:hypothetical protein